MIRLWCILPALALVACTQTATTGENGADAPISATDVTAPAVVERRAPVLQDTPLGQALRPALLQGSTLQAGRAAEASAQSGIEGARGLLRPDVSFGVRAGVRDTTGSQVSPVVQLSQRVFDGGSAANQIASAEARARAAQASTEARLNDRSLAALSAWEELHLARQLEEIAQAATLRYSDFEERIAKRINAGAGRNAEALRVASRRDEAAAELARATGRVAAAEARVRELFRSLPAVGPVPQAPPPRTGFDRNPAVVQINETLSAAQSTLQAREAERTPAVFLDVFGDLDAFDDPSVGTNLRLDYNLGTNGQRAAAIAAARSEVQRIEAERALLFEALEQSAAEAVARQQALTSERTAARRSEEAAEAALADADAGFAGGRFDIFDLLDLGRDLERAASRRAEVEAALRLSAYDRLAISGELLDVFGISLAGAGS